MEIAGKAAVVSGGGSGIGRAAVLALVERGAKVVVADIVEDAGQQTVSLAAEKGGTAVSPAVTSPRPKTSPGLSNARWTLWTV